MKAILGMEFCSFVWLGFHVQVCAVNIVCVACKDQKSTLSVVPQKSTTFLETGSLTGAWTSLIRLDWPMSKPQASFWVCSPIAGIIHTHTHPTPSWLFPCMLGTKLRSSYLCDKNCINPTVLGSSYLQMSCFSCLPVWWPQEDQSPVCCPSDSFSLAV